MRQAYNFLQKCDGYYLLSVDHGKPKGRPFGSVIEYEGCLFFATTSTKSVYHQIKDNPNIQIVAKNPDDNAWIRIDGEAVECYDLFLKEEIMEISPRMHFLFSSAEDPTLSLFRIKDAVAEYQ